MTDPQELADAVSLARHQLGQAKSKVEKAKEQARLAKRRRKEAKQGFRRARKEFKRAKGDLAEAQQLLETAEAKLALAAKHPTPKRAVAKQRVQVPVTRTKPSRVVNGRVAARKKQVAIKAKGGSYPAHPATERGSLMQSTSASLQEDILHQPPEPPKQQ